MSRESKNLHFARRFARQFKSEDDANLLIETIRKEIPNVRKADCKFMLGVTRLCLDKEITTGNDIGNMNEIIKFITHKERLYVKGRYITLQMSVK